jgi:hypothetical protein
MVCASWRCNDLHDLQTIAGGHFEKENWCDKKSARKRQRSISLFIVRSHFPDAPSAFLACSIIESQWILPRNNGLRAQCMYKTSCDGPDDVNFLVWHWHCKYFQTFCGNICLNNLSNKVARERVRLVIQVLEHCVSWMVWIHLGCQDLQALEGAWQQVSDTHMHIRR